MNPVTGEIPTTGYMVGTSKANEQIVPRVKYADIKAYAIKHDAAFRSDNSFMFLGTWFSNGVTYLDVSCRFENKETALQFAKAGGEQAIYDIGKCVDIEVRA
jgi:hypothetical protein